MEFNHIARLKNGEKCVLRHAVGADAQAVLNHMKITFGETDFLLRYPDEMTMTAEQEAAFLENYAISMDSLMLCAEINGRIVGIAGLNPIGRLDKLRHRADLGISVQKEFWGIGVGKALVEDIICAAEKIGYTHLELDVMSANERAIALYEKMGFAAYGKNEKAYRLRNGNYMAATLMQMEL